MARIRKFKSLRRYDIPGDSRFLTFSTRHKRPYLRHPKVADEVLLSLNRMRELHRVFVLSYVLMPDHVHLLLHPKEEKFDVSAALKSLKQGPSRRAKYLGIVADRLWEPGGGYDSNVHDHEARWEMIKYIHLNPVRKEIVSDPAEFTWSSMRQYAGLDGSPFFCDLYQMDGSVLEYSKEDGAPGIS